jgi:hypothetical protein
MADIGLRPRKRPRLADPAGGGEAGAGAADADADAPDGRLRAAVLALAQARSAASGGSICPSEVARKLYSTEAAWRAAMPAVRAAAAALVAGGGSAGAAGSAAGGRLVVTQKGVVVDPATARGAIRLRWVPGPGDGMGGATACAGRRAAAPASGGTGGG